jgi:CubicO group peptidase (beta-lactamase class C family)
MKRRSFLGSLAFTPISSAAQSKLEAALDNLRTRHGIPGLSAGMVRNGELTWTSGLGLANRERNIPVTKSTPFRIASLTKTFASVLLMQFYETGKLNLDEPINRYLPEAERSVDGPIGDDVTIRHIFTHTSQSRPPGDRYAYNGSRFSRLTRVIEALGGKPIRELLAERILDRVQMPRTVPGQDATAERYQAALNDLAAPYKLDKSDNIVLSEYPPKRINAAAGIISTVEDLARYDAAIDAHLLIRRETLELAWTPAKDRSGRPLPYGLGWFVQHERGERLIWHYGYWPGSFSALYLKIPQRKMTFFLLANSDGLSRPFPSLGRGDVTGSAFAEVLLKQGR